MQELRNTDLQTVNRQDIRTLFKHPDLAQYTYELNRFAEYLEEEDLDFGFDEIQSFLANIRCHPATYNKRLAAIKKLANLVLIHYTHIYTQAQCEQVREALAALKTRKYTRNTPDVLTREQYETLLRECPEPSFALIMELLYVTAARISEALGIRWEDLSNQVSHYRAIIHGKGDKYRYVPIPVDLVKRLQKHFKDPDYLVGIRERRWVSAKISRIGKKILGRRVYPHLFRHTRLTHLAQDTGRVKAIQQFAGHSDVNFTMRTYVHDEFTPEDLLA